MKILIVDDTKVARFFSIRALKQLGYESFLEADSVESAVEILKTNNDIGLVLSDWYMPGGSGLELLKYIRIHHTKKDIPFLIQTSDPSKSLVLSAFKFGAQSFLMKPLTAEVLKEKLSEVIKNGQLPGPPNSNDLKSSEIMMIPNNPELGFYLTDHSLLLNIEAVNKSGVPLPPSIKNLDTESEFVLISTEGVDHDYATMILEWEEALKKEKGE